MVRSSRPPSKVPRGQSVVRKVLLAAREELARVGYRALRIEDVASRAGVHKTTIYRRFPDKIDLVRAAMQELFQERFVTTDTGSLRGDLIDFAQVMTNFFSSVEGQSLARMMMTEGTDPELRSIVESVRAKREALPNQVIVNAVARGEISKDTDGDFLFKTLVGAIHHRLFALTQCVSELNIAKLVDLLLYGALPRPKVPAPKRPPSKQRNRSLR
ncbi:MAG: TetR/AcrR family transcriptional regulator [Polyangiaceae bacterium]